MKINNKILVGVDEIGLCQFYHVIHEYNNELIHQYPFTKDSELLGLCIFMDENNILNQVYYFIHNHNHYIASLTIGKDGKNKIWTFDDNYNYKDILEDIKKNKYVLDLEYFLQNN